MKKNSEIHCPTFCLCIGIMLIVIIFPNCTPKMVVKEVHVTPSEQFSGYNAKMLKERIRHLEGLLEDTAGGNTDYFDSTISKERILKDLFELSIHRNNPKPDYQKAYTYAASLYKMKTRHHFYYLNWGRMLNNYFMLNTEKDSLIIVKDSLLQAIEGESKKSKSLQSNLYNLRKQTKQIDSLSTLITDQKETIEKLKKLDVMMEKQRSKIQ